MKNLKFFTLAIAILGFTSVSFAQTPQVNATSEAFATIIAPITINNTAALRFGNIIASAEKGTVIVDTENNRKNEGGAYFPSIQGEVNSAEFKVTGLSGAAYSLTLPKSTNLKSDTGSEMKITNFTANAKQVLTDKGEEVFQLGATLNVEANQLAGKYEGQFEVTVNYN